jgi:hypothetical protein
MKKLKNALQIAYDWIDVTGTLDDKEAMQVIIGLIESVLSVAEKMPQRKEILRGEDEVECFTANDMNRASNEMLDACTLAFAVRLDRDRIVKIIEEQLAKLGIDNIELESIYSEGYKVSHVLADAILESIKDKNEI